MTLKGALLLICACLPTVLVAQHRIIAPSVNPMEDSLAVARVRAKMDSIRQYRPTVAGNLWLLVLPFIFWGLMAFMMKRTEEKWLHNLYGAEYDAYCKRVNRAWPWFLRK